MAVSEGICFGALYYRDIEREKMVALRENRGNFDAFMKLSEMHILACGL